MRHIETAKRQVETLIRSMNIDIILIDDNPYEMKAIKEILRINGFTNVQCITPNHTTVERLEMLNPKLIISDLFGCLGVDAIVKHFGQKMIINTGFCNQMVEDSVGKNVYGVAFKDDPGTLINQIKDFFDLEAA